MTAPRPAIKASTLHVRNYRERMREQGLVSCRRAGRVVFYRVASEQAQALIAVLYRLFCAPGRV